MSSETKKSLPRIDNRSARRLFLDRHGLGPRAGIGTDRQATLDMIRRLGFVQVDSIATVERAHHMILRSRLPGYRQSHLKTLLERDRALFEHWTHDAAVIPIEFYRYWSLRFRRDREKLLPRWRVWRPEGFEAHFDKVLDRIRTHGPTLSREVGGADSRGSNEMWGWHPSKTALEFLWRSGRLAICHRDGFQKCFDLAENVIPGQHRLADPEPKAVIDWACRSALDRLGFATSGEIAAFWDLISPAEAGAWCSDPRTAPPEVEVEMADGRFRKHFAAPGLIEAAGTAPEPPGQLRILSPFDPALRDRKRAERLFGFHFRIEIFVPAEKRKFGYYVFPVLEGERLVGRIDMKRDLDADRLCVKAYWPEHGSALGKGRTARLETELGRAARFAGVSQVYFNNGWQRRTVPPTE